MVCWTNKILVTNSFCMKNTHKEMFWKRIKVKQRRHGRLQEECETQQRLSGGVHAFAVISVGEAQNCAKIEGEFWSDFFLQMLFIVTLFYCRNIIGLHFSRIMCSSDQGWINYQIVCILFRMEFQFACVSDLGIFVVWKHFYKDYYINVGV